ncbi:MAG TPA: hypothetical protein PLQ93_06325 [Bacteroidia bacterium]|nr:hypothetical protein [Bacteroidia bacterium]
MYRKDYLQKQFEEFGKVMALLFGYRMNKALDHYEKEYFNAVLHFTALNASDVENMNADEFKNRIEHSATLSENQLNLLADLLFDRLNFYFEVQDLKAVENLKDKCMFLYAYLNRSGTQNSFNLNNHYRLKFLQNLK